MVLRDALRLADQLFRGELAAFYAGPEVSYTGARLEYGMRFGANDERVFWSIPIVHELDHPIDDRYELHNAGLLFMTGWTSTKQGRVPERKRYVVAGNVRAADPTPGELEHRIAYPVEFPGSGSWTVSRGDEQPSRPNVSDRRFADLFWSWAAYDPWEKPEDDEEERMRSRVVAADVDSRIVLGPEVYDAFSMLTNARARIPN